MAEIRYVTFEDLDRHCAIRHENVDSSIETLFKKLDQLIYLVIACLCTIIGGLTIQIVTKQTDKPPRIEITIRQDENGNFLQDR